VLFKKEEKEAFEEDSRKRQKEHVEVVKAFDKERKEREKEHDILKQHDEETREAFEEMRGKRDEAVKWGRISFAINCFLALVSIYLGYLALS
jgi:hypothetical protein